MKEKSLAVSNRDRKLLSILLAVVIMFLLYMFLASPAYEESLLKKAEISTANSTLASMNDTIMKAPEIKQSIAQKRSDLSEKYKIFLYDLNEPKLLHQIDTILISSGLAANSYQQSVKSVGKVVLQQSGFMENTFPLLDIAKKLNPDLSETAEVIDSNAAPPTEANVADIVEQMDITIGFSNAGYQTVYSFLRAIETLDRSYILSDFALTADQQAAGLQGQVVIKSISLPKINEIESSDMTFQPTIPQGKISPF